MVVLKSVSKYYVNDKGDKKFALFDVNIKLPDRGFVLINGDSGSGKTTFLKIIGGTIRPNMGTVLYDGVSFAKNDDISVYRRNNIGIVYQDLCLIDDLNVRDNLLLVSNSLKEIEEVLSILHIDKYLNKKVGKLSIGERQRVAIARALLVNADLLLCDEVIASLDDENAHNVLNILKNISKEKLVIVTAHSEEELNNYADRIITLDNGKIIHDEIITEGDYENNRPVEKHLNKNNRTFFLVKSILSSVRMNSFFIGILAIIMISFLGIMMSIYEIDIIDIQANTYVHEKDEFMFLDNEDADLLDNVKYRLDSKVYYYDSDPLNLSFDVDYFRDNIYYYNAYEKMRFVEIADDFEMDLIFGEMPSNQDEVVICEYLAEVIMYYGIYLDNGEFFKPESMDEIVGDNKYKLGLGYIKISGIVKNDLQEFNDLKNSMYSWDSKLDSKDNYRYTLFLDSIVGHANTLFVNSSFSSFISEYTNDYVRESELKLVSYESLNLVIDSDYTLENDEIIVPIDLGDYVVGDTLDLSIDGDVFKYSIKGFSDDNIFYLSDSNLENYKKTNYRLDESIVSVALEDVKDVLKRIGSTAIIDNSFNLVGLKGTSYDSVLVSILKPLFLIKNYIIYGIILVIMLFILILVNYSEVLINKNKYKLNVLYNLGYSLKSVRKLLIFSLGIFMLLMLIVASIINFGVISIGNFIYSNTVGFSLTPLSFSLISILLIIMIMIFVILLNILIYSRKYRQEKENI